jgi:hypothetical protein
MIYKGITIETNFLKASPLDDDAIEDLQIFVESVDITDIVDPKDYERIKQLIFREVYGY